MSDSWRGGSCDRPVLQTPLARRSSSSSIQCRTGRAGPAAGWGRQPVFAGAGAVVRCGEAGGRVRLEGAQLVGPELFGELRLQDRIGARGTAAQMRVSYG